MSGYDGGIYVVEFDDDFAADRFAFGKIWRFARMVRVPRKQNIHYVLAAALLPQPNSPGSAREDLPALGSSPLSNQHRAVASKVELSPSKIV
jgi:hypothetical protein